MNNLEHRFRHATLLFYTTSIRNITERHTVLNVLDLKCSRLPEQSEKTETTFKKSQPKPELMPGQSDT